MHGVFSEFSHENYGRQVKKSVHKTVPAKFSSSIFSWPVFYDLFTKSCKAGPFCNQWNITVHFTIYLDVFYYLTPLPRKSLKAEITTITRSNDLNGSVITLSWRDRNIFKGGEHLSISGYAGSDVQFSGQFKGYNAIRFGGEINFSIPRVLVPFGDFGSKGGYMPRTNIQLGYELPINRKFIRSLRLYVSGQDLWETTKVLSVFDPEVGNNVSATSYPFYRTISFGFNVGL